MIGDGQGLATVAAAVEALHGTVMLETHPGESTRVTITVPTSRALQDAVLVTAAGQTWGIPCDCGAGRPPLHSAGCMTPADDRRCSGTDRRFRCLRRGGGGARHHRTHRVVVATSLVRPDSRDLELVDAGGGPPA
jgi:hypothetical protein